MSFLDALASLDFKLSVGDWYFLQLAHLRVFQIIFLDPFPYYDIENLSQKEEEKILWNMFLFL